MTTTHKAYIAPILRAIIDEPAINIKHIFKKDPNIYYLPRFKTTKELLAQAIDSLTEDTNEAIALQALANEYSIIVVHSLATHTLQGGYIAIPYEAEYKIIVPLN